MFLIKQCKSQCDTTLSMLNHFLFQHLPESSLQYYQLTIHAGAALKSWLHDFLSTCLSRLKIPKIWKRALVVTIPKPIKL